MCTLLQWCFVADADCKEQSLPDGVPFTNSSDNDRVVLDMGLFCSDSDGRDNREIIGNQTDTEIGFVRLCGRCDYQ